MRPAALLVALLALVAAPPAAGVVLPPGFETERELSGLTRATAVAWAPDGRRFVAEKDGRLKVADPGSATARTILDIRARVNAYLDRGLLGLAVDADFPSEPYVYLLYTYDVAYDTAVPGPDSGTPTVAQLLRATIGPGSQVVDSKVILGSHTSGPCPPPGNAVDCIPADAPWHTIGTVLSAPDGSLYVGSGDAADPATTDPLALRTYDERSMAGKLLRVDRDGRGVAGHPFCPAETDLTLVCTKVHAKGFRNPFRFTRLTDGSLLVGDVGWNDYEELNLVSAGGGDYGWPCYEGPGRTPTWRDVPACESEYAKEGTPAAATAPAYSYRRTSPSAAVIAGPQYTGDAYPAAYSGAVFWGDFGGRFLRTASVVSPGVLGPIGEFGHEWDAVDLKSAPNGDLTWVEMGDFGTGDARVERMVHTPGNSKPTAVAAATPRDGDVPLTVEFDASGSTDPDGDTLSYRWDFGDGSAPAEGSGVSHTYTAAGTYIASLTVADGRGRAHTDAVEINASNTPPVPRIDLPAAGFLYRNDAPVRVEGSATDAEEGSLPGSRFEWSVRLVHHDHEHLLESPTGEKAIEFAPLRGHDADSHYVARLTVTDSGGATRSVERELQPQTVALRLRSVPSGAPLSYAGVPAVTPWDTVSVIGFIGTVSAPETYISGGVRREFAGWSSGAPRVHDFSVPAAPAELTAFYNARPVPVAEPRSVTGRAPLRVTLDASASTDPDEDALAFAWDPGDGGPVKLGPRIRHRYPPGFYSARVTVSDGRGGSSTEYVHITVKPDRAGPAITVRRPGPRPRALAGVVRDPSGVRVMRAALARLGERGRCRWVRGRPPRLAGGSKPCDQRRWLDAVVEGRRWRVELPRTLPAGRYAAWLLARDGAGNQTRRTTDGRHRLRFTVRPGHGRVR